MKNIRPKVHVIPWELKKIWPENKIVYTLEHYTSGRVWHSGTFTFSILVHMDSKEFEEIMKEKFNCVDYNFDLFYKTKKDCQEAIEFLETLIITQKLLR